MSADPSLAQIDSTFPWGHTNPDPGFWLCS